MLKKAVAVVAALLLLGPMMGLVGIALIANPASNAQCTISDNVMVTDIPDELTVTTAGEVTFTLNKKQLTHAATIIETGAGIDGVGVDGIRISLMAALTESTLRQLANTGTYPESGDYPNDGNGSDHDSLGLFQMRPQSGWGTVAELMDTTYQARAFFGGPDGPNYPSPRGLLDIPGWEQLDPGEAAQAVEVSAYPDRYQDYRPVADSILDALTKPSNDPSSGNSGSESTGEVVPETSGVVFPLPEGTWVQTDVFGPRTDPITGEAAFHSGIDLGAPGGTAILAAADGVVTVAEFSGGYGGLIIIEHTVDGQTVVTAYGHMWQDGIHVTAGDHVTAGQHIGDVGSSGRSTGNHLHFEVRPGGTNGEAIDPTPWLTDHDATDLLEPSGSSPDQCRGA